MDLTNLVEDFNDFELAQFAPTDSELRAFIEHNRLEAEKQDALSMQCEPEYPLPENANCIKCGELCPSGTFTNGLCSLCDLVGKIIWVKHWNLPVAKCRVTRISRNGTIYAQRYFVSLGTWSKERPVHYYKGIYHLGARHKPE